MIAFLIFLFALFSFFINKRGLSLFLLAGLLSGGFWIIGVNTTLLGISIRLTDFALLYVLIILTYNLFSGRLKKLPKQLRPVHTFYGFLAISVLVDIIINGTSITDVFRTTRHWLFLLFVFLLPSFKRKDIIKAFKLILGITVIELMLFLTEPITGKVIFSPDGTLEALSMSGVTRYALLPPFLFLLFVWVFVSKQINTKVKSILLFFIAIAVIITTTRSFLIVLLIVFSISVFISKKGNGLRKIGIVTLLFVVIFSASFYKPLMDRFTNSIEDIQSIGKTSSEVEGNFSFRFLLFSERLSFIMEKPQTAIFGMGFITEKHFSKDIFNFGLVSKKNNEQIQLDTADIAWALFSLRLGIIGTILYLLIYYNLFKFFWSNKNNDYAMMGFYYLIIYFFLSLSGVDIFYGTFIFIPALFYQLIKYKKSKLLII